MFLYGCGSNTVEGQFDDNNTTFQLGLSEDEQEKVSVEEVSLLPQQEVENTNWSMLTNSEIEEIFQESHPEEDAETKNEADTHNIYSDEGSFNLKYTDRSGKTAVISIDIPAPPPLAEVY